MFMFLKLGFVNQPKIGAKSLITPVDWDTRHNTNHKLFCDFQSHLRS